MRMSPLNLKELAIVPETNHELTSNALYEKIIMIAISYFSIATEYRFLDNAENLAFYQNESKYWHKAAVEIACSFLPSECPLVDHILTSYEKHNPINEEDIVRNLIRFRM